MQRLVHSKKDNSEAENVTEKRTKNENMLALMNAAKIDLLNSETNDRICEGINRQEWVKFKSIRNTEFTNYEIVSVFFFKTNSDYKNHIRELYNDDNYQKLFKKNSLNIQSLFTAFQKLPFYYGTVLTGMSLGNENLSAYQAGNIILWKTYVECSDNRSKYVEETFLDAIFEIVNARLKDFSKFYGDKQYFFMPFTYFEVIQVKREENRYFIKLSEIGPDDFTVNQTVLWVDDKPENNLEIIKSLNEKNIIVKLLTSTEFALHYLGDNNSLLDKSLNSLRIVTDAVRIEDGKENYEAGIKLVKDLRNFGYQEKILMYVGRQSYDLLKKLNEIKINDNLKINDLNIICTNYRPKCLEFVTFETSYTTRDNIFM